VAVRTAVFAGRRGLADPFDQKRNGPSAGKQLRPSSSYRAMCAIGMIKNTSNDRASMFTCELRGPRIPRPPRCVGLSHSSPASIPGKSFLASHSISSFQRRAYRRIADRPEFSMLGIYLVW
jgi:hypothetical protein